MEVPDLVTSQRGSDRKTRGTAGAHQFPAGSCGSQNPGLDWRRFCCCRAACFSSFPDHFRVALFAIRIDAQEDDLQVQLRAHKSQQFQRVGVMIERRGRRVTLVSPISASASLADGSCRSTSGHMMMAAQACGETLPGIAYLGKCLAHN